MQKTRKFIGVLMVLLMVLSVGGITLTCLDNNYFAFGEDDKQTVENAKDDGQDADVRSAEDSSQAKETAGERSIVVTPEEAVLYEADKEGKNHISNTLKDFRLFWNSLSGRTPVLSENSGKERKAPVKVKITGDLPEDVTAKATYIEAGEDASYTERALYALEVKLYDAKGEVYIPESPVRIAVAGRSITGAFNDNNAFLVYSYLENQEREAAEAKKDEEGLYAADVMVYRDSYADVDHLTYGLYDRDKDYKKGEDAVRYAEDENGLTVYDNKTIAFEYDYDKAAETADEALTANTARFVVSAQASKEELEAADKTAEAEAEKAAEEKKATEDEKATENEKTAEEEKTIEDENAAEDKKAAKDEKESGTETKAKSGKKTIVNETRKYKVTVTYGEEAGLPADVQLKVKELKGIKYRQYRRSAAKELGAEKMDYARAFDITIVDSEGNEYEPDSDVDVKIELINDKKVPDELQVVHFEGSYKEEASVIESETKGEAISFETDGFSVYVIVDTPRRTYIFREWRDGVWADIEFTTEGGLKTTEQTVRNGQMPVIPSPSVKENKVFAGWYEQKQNGEFYDDPYDFNTPVTEDEVVDLYAVFTDYRYVVFHDQFNNDIGSFSVADTRRGEQDTTGKAKVQISDMSTTYNGGSDMAFWGWSETPITIPGSETDDDGQPVTKVQTDSEGFIEIDKDTDLYPIYKPVKWLSYWSGPTGSGATYYPSQKYFNGDGPENKLPVPVWNGHTFQGWYAGSIDEETGEPVLGTVPLTDENGNLINGHSDGGMSVHSDQLHLANDATLYAKWSGEPSVDYKIIIWKQKTTDRADLPEDDRNYDFYESVIKTVNIGSPAVIDNEYKQYNQDEDKPELRGYTCRYDADEDVVNDKGYTVLNVYYDRADDYTPTGSNHTLAFEDSGNDRIIKEYTGLSYGESLASRVPVGQTKENYAFDGWFADKNCTTQVFFTKSEYDSYTGYNQKVLYDSMPDNNLTVYAGWSAEWYLVQIDPNYGDFNGSGSTWMWKTVDSDLIQEYTQATRDYVESSSGKYYYAKRDRAYYGYTGYEWDNSEPDRDAYYTDDTDKATELGKTFENVPGIYTYVGSFEVLKDGSEIPYDFTKHVDHNTMIRLHWKKMGSYYLKYDAGEGTLDNADEGDIDKTIYADEASIVLKRGATAPNGYTFAGWKVKGDDSDTVYKVGGLFTLKSDYAASISGKDTITLEAVYEKLGTASIEYHFNGGTLNGEFDPGQPSADDAPTIRVRQGENTVTVSNIINNSDFWLSSGANLTVEGAEFKGWSVNEVFDPETDELFEPSELNGDERSGDTYGVDKEEPIRLYAVWETDVTYHINNPEGTDSADYQWGGTWEGYTPDDLQNPTTYSKKIYIGNKADKPTDTPQYTGQNQTMFRYWATSADGNTAYDFSSAVTGRLDLYAYWDGSINVPIHTIDASAPDDELPVKDGEEGWISTEATIPVLTSHVNLDTIGSNYTPEGYAYAFAVALGNRTDPSRKNVFEENAVSEIYYNQSENYLYVKYKDNNKEDSRLVDVNEIYFVYYQQKKLSIGYKKMTMAGELVAAEVTGVPEDTVDSLGEYKMAEKLTQPKTWANNLYDYYAYAIGEAGATDATGLCMISTASNSEEEGSRPIVTVKNTWSGFKYKVGSDESAQWVDCGHDAATIYDPTLYVVYYEKNPTVVMFGEKTVGLSEIMDTQFTYNLLITQAPTTTTSVQKQKKSGDEWINEGDPDVTTDTGESTVIYDTTASGNDPYILKNGEEASAILFYSLESHSEETGAPYEEGGNTYRNVTTTTVADAQTAKITQTEDDKFTTKIDVDGSRYTGSNTVYTYTADGSGGTKSVIYTNTHKQKEIEVHVARIENGKLICRDDKRSIIDPSTYKFSLGINNEKEFLEELPAGGVYTDSSGEYEFGAIVYGKTSKIGSEDIVNVTKIGAAFIAYDKNGEDDSYALLMKDSNKQLMGDLGSDEIYYLYYPKPTIQYVKLEKGSDNVEKLSRVRGSMDGTNPSPNITVDYKKIRMNGQDVVQNQRIAVPLEGLFISQQAGNANFKMPPVLDDKTLAQYLAYSSIGYGETIAEGQEIIPDKDNISNDMKMQLQIRDKSLWWSFDGDNWHPYDEAKTIYAVYTERGYDFQISKVVDTSESGVNPIFTDREFTVTIEPVNGNSFNKEIYDIDGYAENGRPVDKVNVVDGKITLVITDGTKVKLHGMREGSYKVTESNNHNFELTAKSGPITGSATHEETVTKEDNGSSVTMSLDSEKQLKLTNTPEAICELNPDSTEEKSDGDGILFYTLRDAIEYVTNNIESRTANIAMLTDYPMQEADTVEIPANAHVTLTTAHNGQFKYESVGNATISRSPDLLSVPMITNGAKLDLTKITLDGGGNTVSAIAPMIYSTGTLKVQIGTVLQNAHNTGSDESTAVYKNKGGAVFATGTVSIEGADAEFSGNKAVNGGAIYYAGTGSVTVSGGNLKKNIATENGGAVYAVGGTVTVSGGTFGGQSSDGNQAVGNSDTTGRGGAIYSEGAQIVLSGGEFKYNSAKDGGAVYSHTGNVTVSAGTNIQNNTSSRNGGAICTDTGSLSVSGGEIHNNTAGTAGGAIYSQGGTVSVSGGTITENGSVNGGAIYANNRTVTVSGGSISGNTATQNGGAIYNLNGAVNISGDNTEVSSNGAANGNGGAVYAGTGAVSISGGTISSNSATNGYGGAIYSDTGSVSITGNNTKIGVTLKPNVAKNGAAVYIKEGSGSFSGGTISNNWASEGGAVGMYNEGVRLTFSGSIQIRDNQLRSDPDTIEALQCNVYLDQDTDAIINTSGLDNGAYVGIYVPDKYDESDPPQEYLYKNRGDIGAEFGICTGNLTAIPQFNNDRSSNLKAIVNSLTKKVFWSSAINVQVKYLANYKNSIPNGNNGDNKYNNNNYYPAVGNAAISLLADELHDKCQNLSGTAVYATSFAVASGVVSYDDYITRILWQNNKWWVEKRDGSQEELNNRKLVIYYSEPAYVSIENNSKYDYAIESLQLTDFDPARSILNKTKTSLIDDGYTGWGLVFAKDGTIQKELLPVNVNEQGKFVLNKNGGSINILIPGGCNMKFSLDGNFVFTDEDPDLVELRMDGVEQAPFDPASPRSLSATTKTKSGDTYEIVFGADKAICKIVCDVDPEDVQDTEYVDRTTEPDTEGNYEYTFSKVKQAVAFIKTHIGGNDSLRDVTIEMLVDYLMPGTDVVAITYSADIIPAAERPNYDVIPTLRTIGFTTATTGEFRYPGTDEKRRATISRHSNNKKAPLITVYGNGMAAKTDFVKLSATQINFDGKALTGSCDGGAIKTGDCTVYVEDADFDNFIAQNGGAMFVMFGRESANGNAMKYTFPTGYFNGFEEADYDNYVRCEIINANYNNCMSKTSKSRCGGGALWSNCEKMILRECEFKSCEATDQGGAVFHRIESQSKNGYTPYPYCRYSKTEVSSNCIFTGCSANAAGGIESDAHHVSISGSTFTQCTAKARGGGGINIYIHDTADYNDSPTDAIVFNCEFNSCNAQRDGGGFNCGAKTATVQNSRFYNCNARGNTNPNKGGGIYFKNTYGDTATVEGCTFNDCSSSGNNSDGGGICCNSVVLKVKDYIDTDTGAVTHTSLKNCTSANHGGGIAHLKSTTGSATYISGCTITDCTSVMSGGGIYTQALNATYDENNDDTKLLVGCTIQRCRSIVENNQGVITGGRNGGGVQLDSNSTYAVIENCTISDCESWYGGGGIFCKPSYLIAENLTISGCKSYEKPTNGLGGGIYIVRDGSAEFTDCTIEGCSASVNGGGLYTSNSVSLSFTDCTIRDNSTNGNGGGICYNKNANKSFTLNNTTVEGNTADLKGGGIYTKNYLALINSIIKDNRLSSDMVTNAAGVYIDYNGGNSDLLRIGTKNAEYDYSAVMGNTTSNGADSNLRLPEKTDGSENNVSVVVYCGLGPKNGEEGNGGYFGVVNAKKVGTQFGKNSSGLDNPAGLSHTDTVFHSDVDTLYGIIDTTDSTHIKIIWAGPPVCKVMAVITDESGNTVEKLLYFKTGGNDPAIFDVLEDGKGGSNRSRTSAFALMRSVMTNQNHYSLYDVDGNKYTGSAFSIKMLVGEYELTTQITTVDNADKTITLTTAGKNDKDGYPLDSSVSGDRCSINRGPNVTDSMAIASCNMKFNNIILDGNNIEVKDKNNNPANGGIIRVGGTKAINVELQSRAILQYGKAENGGAISVDNGTFRLNGGLIRFCTAEQNGGAVYISDTTVSKSFKSESGNIQGCSSVNGGGVYVAGGVFDMSGGTISGCNASDSGGGVFVADGKTMNMSGGFIGYEAANTAGQHGGGIAVGGYDSRLNFERQVNVSKNTCNGHACNVELGLYGTYNPEKTNQIINSKGLYGKSYIGVYVAGVFEPLDADDREHGYAHHRGENTNDTDPYKHHGGEGDPFGSFNPDTDKVKATLYCFVNDRNGLKGGLISGGDPQTIYWIKIFSVEVSKHVEVSNFVPEDLKTAAKEQEFTYDVILHDKDNIGIKVADIAAEIKQAEEEGEESKYGNIPFQAIDGDDSRITATITLKDGEFLSAENLPAGIEYEVTEHWAEGYCHIPESYNNDNRSFMYAKGETGENKDRTDVNPYVSDAAFNNILAACKVTTPDGQILYRNGSTNRAKQIPAAYKDLNEAFEIVNEGTLYTAGTNVSYNGKCKIEMLVYEYILDSTESHSSTLNVRTNRLTELTTASKNAADHFRFNSTVTGHNVDTSKIRRGSNFTQGPMILLYPNCSADLTIERLRLDGNKILTDTNGGIVYVSRGSKLRVKNKTEMANSRIRNGKGAGVYVDQDAELYLSGSVKFGGADTGNDEYLYNDTGNFTVDEFSASAGKKNGDKAYTVAHQDIYVNDKEDAPTSIIIEGKITGENASIWVWNNYRHSASEDAYNHYKTLMPFARFINESVKNDPGNMKVFRNAMPDDQTNAVTDTGSYLYGTADVGNPPDGSSGYFVYWNGLKGSSKVILRKVKGSNNSYNPPFSIPAGTRKFHIYISGTTTTPRDASDTSGRPINGGNEITMGDSGIIWIGELPYGEYDIVEVNPERTFTIKVDDKGIHDVKQDNAITKKIHHE